MNTLSLKEFMLEQWKKRGIVRVGQCLGCGKCCEGGVRIFSCQGDTIVLKERKEIQCIYYTERTKNCTNYNNRCEWCSLFPYLPEVMYEGCGYRFIKIENLLKGDLK
jgi:uncharacterized cysteine cluster protein YcgN (CxxCxxCC family)